eukprot:s2300_g2.t1
MEAPLPPGPPPGPSLPPLPPGAPPTGLLPAMPPGPPPGCGGGLATDLGRAQQLHHGGMPMSEDTARRQWLPQDAAVLHEPGRRRLGSLSDSSQSLRARHGTGSDSSGWLR